MLLSLGFFSSSSFFFAELQGTKGALQYSNAVNAVFFDAVHLVVHYDTDQELQIMATTQLGNHLVAKEPNLRFLALEGLSAMAQTEFSHDSVKKHMPTVLKALKTEKDSTVQRRAVDVLYAVCDKASVVSIVSELLDFLEQADYSVREEVVLKIAILAEKHVTDYKWWVIVLKPVLAVACNLSASWSLIVLGLPAAHPRVWWLLLLLSVS